MDRHDTVVHGENGSVLWVAVAGSLAGLVAAVVIGSGVFGAGPDRSLRGGPSPAGSMHEAGVPSAAVVSAKVVATALGSHAPPHPTMSDEIDHFRARLASENGEGSFARRRLASAHLLRFRAYGAQEDIRAAERHLDELLSARAPSRDLLSLESSLRLLVHDFPGALAAARTANTLTSDYDSALRLRLFDVLWATGSYETAAGLLELPHDRTSFDFLVREARVMDRRGDVAGARDRLARAVSEARAYAEPAAVIAWGLTELGHFEHHAGHPERAVERYLEALETLPGYPAALEGLAGLAWGVDRQPAVAHALFAHALRSGGHLDLYLDLAATAEEGGRHERAEAARQEFIRRATTSPEAEREHLRPLALVLSEHYPEQIDQAMAYAERDQEMRPESGAWDTLAWVRYHMGDLESAWDAATRATAWGVPEPTVLYHAGVIAHESGRTERAHALLKAAREGASELSRAEIHDIDTRLNTR